MPDTAFSFTILSAICLITTAFLFNMWVSTSELCSEDQSFVTGLSSHIQSSHAFAKKSASWLLRKRFDRKAWPVDTPIPTSVTAPSARVPKKTIINFLEGLSKALLNPNVPSPSVKEINAAILLLSLLNSSVKIKKAGTDLSHSASFDHTFDLSIVSAVMKVADSIVRRTKYEDDATLATILESNESSETSRFASASASSALAASIKKDTPFHMNIATAESMKAAYKQVTEEEDRVLSSAEKLRTHQTCYLQNDESEICTYEGVVCFDGVSIVTVVDKPLDDNMSQVDEWIECVDKRYNEPSSPAFGCTDKVKAFSRDPLNPQLLSSTRFKYTNFSFDFPLPLIGKRWGPANRNGLLFREIHVNSVWGSNPMDLASKLGMNLDTNLIVSTREADSARVLWSSSDDQTSKDNLPSLPEGLVKLRSISPEKGGIKHPSIDWVDTSLFFVGLDKKDTSTNHFHSSMTWKSHVIGPLFDSMRHNSSRGGFGSNENDGYVRFLPLSQITSMPSIMMNWSKQEIVRANDIIVNKNKALYRQGRFWNIPPMDAVVFTGDGARDIDNVNVLPELQMGFLKMATSSNSRYFFNDVLSKLSPPSGTDPGHMMCTTKPSVVVGNKFKIFAGRGDGWMFRQYAYQHAKLPLCVGKANVLVDPETKKETKCYRAHPKYAPRKITVLDDDDSSIFGGSFFWNIDVLMEAVAEVGLPFERRTKVMELPFIEQVKLFADTGILIAPHGHPGLANIPFLSVHSAVIEIFPMAAYGRDTQFECEMLDLHYFPVFSLELPKARQEKMTHKLYSPDYWSECQSQNVTMAEVNAYETCFKASLTFPSVVSKYRIKLQLRDAVDSVGSFSLKNPEWAKVAEKEGVPVPPKPDSISDVDKFGING